MKWRKYAGSVHGNVLVAGKYGSTERPLGIARAVMSDGTLAVGKFDITQKVATISWAGKEIVSLQFQYLTIAPELKGTLTWVCAGNGAIPDGAFWVENLQQYIGRRNINGETIPGRISTASNKCYCAYSGMETAESKYEVLVSIHCETMSIPEEGILPGRFKPDAGIPRELNSYEHTCNTIQVYMV